MGREDADVTCLFTLKGYANFSHRFLDDVAAFDWCRMFATYCFGFSSPAVRIGVGEERDQLHDVRATYLSPLPRLKPTPMDWERICDKCVESKLATSHIEGVRRILVFFDSVRFYSSMSSQVMRPTQTWPHILVSQALEHLVPIVAREMKIWGSLEHYVSNDPVRMIVKDILSRHQTGSTTKMVIHEESRAARNHRKANVRLRGVGAAKKKSRRSGRTAPPSSPTSCVDSSKPSLTFAASVAAPSAPDAPRALSNISSAPHFAELVVEMGLLFSHDSPASSSGDSILEEFDNDHEASSLDEEDESCALHDMDGTTASSPASLADMDLLHEDERLPAQGLMPMSCTQQALMWGEDEEMGRGLREMSV
jgi:hypothetical protein